MAFRMRRAVGGNSAMSNDVVEIFRIVAERGLRFELLHDGFGVGPPELLTPELRRKLWHSRWELYAHLVFRWHYYLSKTWNHSLMDLQQEPPWWTCSPENEPTIPSRVHAIWRGPEQTPSAEESR